jgi:hypothetical protein
MKAAAEAAEAAVPRQGLQARRRTSHACRASINENAVVPGGTYTEGDSDTTENQDVDISIAGSDCEMQMDRLAYADGWSMEIVPDMLASYEVVSPLEYVFKLRPGIKTHNIPTGNMPTPTTHASNNTLGSRRWTRSTT